MSGIEFEGKIYNDDRMFVLYLCKCSVRIEGNLVTTTIYHEKAPSEHDWALVTYKNVARYEACRIDRFKTVDAAKAYMETVEPLVPLISLGGRPSEEPLTCPEFQEWKKRNNLKDYDYKIIFSTFITDPKEVFYEDISLLQKANTLLDG